VTEFFIKRLKYSELCRTWVGKRQPAFNLASGNDYILLVTNTKLLTHCGRVTQICVFNTVKNGTSASSP